MVGSTLLFATMTSSVLLLCVPTIPGMFVFVHANKKSDKNAWYYYAWYQGSIRQESEDTASSAGKEEHKQRLSEPGAGGIAKHGDARCLSLSLDPAK